MESGYANELMGLRHHNFNKQKDLIMKWKVLKTDEDYAKASIRMMEIFNAEPNTPENDELELLIVLVNEYDKNIF